MYNDSKEQRKVILPTNDLNFKRLFASPELIHISEGFLQDLAAYDPLGGLRISALSIETPYNFQEVNQLRSHHEHLLLNTEVDYACRDENGSRFLLEMQKRDQTYLEERVAYNIGQKFAQHYARTTDKTQSKYANLKPVIGVIILEDNHFKDEIAIRFLRPYDFRHQVYKNNLNLGLEIYVEINKDTSKLPKNLQLWLAYFKTGRVPEEAPSYLQEAATMSEITAFTKEERELADLIDRLEQKRLAEEEARRLKHLAEEEARRLRHLAEEEARRLKHLAEEEARRLRHLAEEEDRRLKHEAVRIELETARTEAEVARTEAEVARTEAETTMTKAKTTMTEAKALMAEAEVVTAEAVKSIEQERRRAEAEKLEIAKSLLQTNMPAGEVAKHAKLSIEQIKALIV
ncbi:MAG: PD-(D/E)XK nuclease family transposase [Defluviitaleaceae bacterium]|nr:PD-(D/E)XK nuclease family transposase [Defluviitaleaceae bacterium]